MSGGAIALIVDVRDGPGLAANSFPDEDPNDVKASRGVTLNVKGFFCALALADCRTELEEELETGDGAVRSTGDAVPSVASAFPAFVRSLVLRDPDME